MKSIAESMHNFDRENFQRVAAGLPEMQDEQAVKRLAAKTAEIFNELFRQLLAVFPALASKTPEEMNEMRRQWLLAFKENGIVSMEQINAGMRVARKQDRPFMPSPGQFVAWCKSESAVSAGLPDAVELVDMVYQYCRTRGQYPDAESYPWPEHNVTPVTLKHKACYWMVTGLYADMRANGLSDAELRRKAQDELMRMVRRLNAGEAIPEPVKQIPKLGGRPLSQEQGLNKIAEIRAKFGLGRGRS
ncbi:MULTISPECIES: replication protein P [unclassified Klebsiella]|uniref:replication protein P n=1 Tax=unclassified Klebsiella TaxID=2608929 RepID=UPI000C2B01F2|nr:MULTISPECIES: replication protein P [unclassified Klebsiella]PJX60173.1 Replication protein P [Klebsiella sp. F-Nf9]PKJ69229.1 Replication protein P [Klebsiella sp. X1-16S-Nf21]